MLFIGLAETSATFSRASILTNDVLLPVVPSPKFPYPLYPADHNLLLLSIANVETFPALILIIPCKLSTLTGNAL